MFKLLKLIVVFLFLSVLLLPIFLLDSVPRVEKVTQVSPQEIKAGHALSKRLLGALSSASTEVTVQSDELSSATKVLSFSQPLVSLESALTPLGVQLSGSFKLPLQGFEYYVNGTCILVNGAEEFEIDTCWFGDVKVPGSWAEAVAEYVLENYVGRNAFMTWYQLVKGAQIEGQQLVVRNLNGRQLRQLLKGTVSETSGLINGSNAEATSLIEGYLNDLEQQKLTNRSLATVTQYLFGKVKNNTSNMTSQQVADHNLAAIWALAIKYGSPKFAHLAQIQRTVVKGQRLTLNGRGDLALHFLYSAILQINSDEQTAFNIGELKELLDTNKGGSGFSFADLVADKAGVHFAKVMTDAEVDLQSKLTKLVLVPDEGLFMAQINNKPEGLSQQQFEQRYQDIQSPGYRTVVYHIEQEIVNLPLYRQ